LNGMELELMRSNFGMFRLVWRLLTPRQRRELLALQLVAFAMGVCTLGGIAAIIPFFAVLGDPENIGRYALLARLYAALGFADVRTFGIFLGCLFVAAVFLSNAINLFGTLAINRFALRVGHEFHVALFEEYLHRDYLFHARNGSVTLMNNILYETARAVTGVVQGGVNLVANAFACLLILVSVMWLDPWLAAGTALLFAATYALIYFGLRRRLALNGAREAATWDVMLRTLTESFGGIREIQLRGNQAHFRDVFAAQCAAIARLGAGMMAMAQSPRYILECVMVAALVGAALWLQQGAGSARWISHLSFLALAAYRLLPAMHQAFSALARIRADRSAFERIAGDLLNARAAPHRAQPVEADLAPWRGRPRRELRVRNVSFRYAEDQPLAIRGATLDIPAGSLVGFVGANGSGKTTLGDLVLGLLQPQTGNIEVDGIPLDATVLPLWRASVAHVPQEVFLFDASIRENIAPGIAAADVDCGRLRAALAAARLDQLVASVPDGVEHRLGERGIRLSGGQRQRIGIARALYCRASLLVFDEATSSLDGWAEQDIVATLHALRGEVTTIVIAHRLTTVRDCDLIYEFDAGAVVGRGTYEDLRRDSHKFRALASGAA
jgi:ATP-binding cassette, subfamily B, bacterial PglK